MKEITTPEADFPEANAINYASKYLEILREKSTLRDYFMHVLLVASTIKSASVIIVNNENRDFIIEAINNLGLKYHEKKLDNQGTSELFVARDNEKLKEYETLLEDGHADNVDWADWEARQGRLFGYSESAIAEFNKNESPHKFWKDVAEKKEIPDELILAFGTTDMIPAGIDDQESIQWGAKIKNFIDKIDPEITKKLVSDFKKEIFVSANEQIKLRKQNLN